MLQHGIDCVICFLSDITLLWYVICKVYMTANKMVCVLCTMYDSRVCVRALLSVTVNTNVSHIRFVRNKPQGLRPEWHHRLPTERNKPTIQKTRTSEPHDRKETISVFVSCNWLVVTNLDRPSRVGQNWIVTNSWQSRHVSNSTSEPFRYRNTNLWYNLLSTF